MATPFASLGRRPLKVPPGTEEMESIHRELEAILASDHFRNSRRYPVFLAYIVETVLRGKAGEIKERSVGIEAFGRPVNYDTNVDPIVRLTAGEVRKRLALYYAEHPLEGGRVEISLQPGSYIPEFYQADLPSSQEGEGTAPTPRELDLADMEAPERGGLQASEAEAGSRAAQESQRAFRLSPRLPILLLPAVLALAAALAALWWRSAHTSQSLWGDFLATGKEVLIVVPKVSYPTGNEPPTWILYNPDVALEDVIALAPPAGILTAHEVPYTIKLDRLVSLSDLVNRPVILIGGPTNKWTCRLTGALRYHLKSDPGDLHIEDSQNPAAVPCSYQLNPDLSVRNDCALIARFHSTLTGGSVIVIAGAGRNGTQAAGAVDRPARSRCQALPAASGRREGQEPGAGTEDHRDRRQEQRSCGRGSLQLVELDPIRMVQPIGGSSSDPDRSTGWSGPASLRPAYRQAPMEPM